MTEADSTASGWDDETVMDAADEIAATHQTTLDGPDAVAPGQDDENPVSDEPGTPYEAIEETQPDETLPDAAIEALTSPLDLVTSPAHENDNPVVRKLLEQAAARRSGQALKFLTESGEENAETVLFPSEPDKKTLDDEDHPAGGPPVAPDPKAQSNVLRGFARDLVRDGRMQERRAVSVALKAREAGVSFLRMLARDRMAGDLAEVYRAVARRCGQDLIADKSTLFPILEHAQWLSASLADRFEVLPLSSPEDGVFRYATVDPFDVAVRDWIQRRSGRDQVVAIPVLPDVLLDGLGRYRSLGSDSDDHGTMFVPIDISWAAEETRAENIEGWDIPVVVDYILHKAHEFGASDVHIEPTGENLIVRNRVDGVLHEELRLPREMQATVIARIKVLSNLDVAERRLPQDGRISVAIRDQPVDIRVSTLPTVTGEKIVMRLLDESALRPRPESLGLTDHDLRLLLDRINAPYGMIMLSGPTGSGKTTTLYSCLSSIDRVARNVVTIEDPVEYRLKGVHQTQVNDTIGMTFANGLRTILRQDPDVIMVGECRDRETAHLAVQASLTGHLVFSTIHANDAAGVVNRLLDMNVEPFLIANALSLVIAQRLVRVHCEHCVTTLDGQEILAGLRAEGVSAEKLHRLGIRIEPDLPYSATTGCSHCRHTGYAGRQAVHELFAMTDELREEILSDHFDLSRFRGVARDAGMMSMMENAIYLVEEGRTSFSEVIRVLGDS